LTTRQYIPEDSELHVRVKFLPANTTPILQLMDQGIIRSFKQRCHKHLVCRYFQQIMNTKETFSFFIWRNINVDCIAEFCELANQFKLFSEDRVLWNPRKPQWRWLGRKSRKLGRCPRKAKITFTSEEDLHAEDNLLSCAVQEIDELCYKKGVEAKNKENYEKEAALVYRSFATCSKAMQCLDTYHYFHSCKYQNCAKCIFWIRQQHNKFVFFWGGGM